MTLTRRLLLLVLLALLPLIAVEAYNQLELRREREREVAAAAVRQAERLAAEERRVIDGVRQVLATLVELPEVRDQDAAACDPLFAAIRPRHPDLLAIAATRDDGRVFCAGDAAAPGTALPDAADRPYFRRAMATGTFTVGGHEVGRLTGAHVQHFAMPYLDRAGRRAGVVVASLGLDWLAAQLDGPQWDAQQAFSLVDADGVILVRQPDHARFVGRPFPPELWARVKDADAPGSYELPSPLDGVPRIVGYVPPAAGPGGLYVGVGVARAAAFAALDAATWRAALVGAAALALALLLAWAFGDRYLRHPVEALLATIARWRAGDRAVRSGLAGASELARLGRAFDAMADEVDRALAGKDLLLRELSHRVANSLATVASLFAVQARTVGDPAARRQLDEAAARVRSVALAYRRMRPAEGAGAVEFAGLLRELWRDLAASLLPEDGAGAGTVEADPVLLGAEQAMPLALVVNELVTNAVKHGGAAGGVTVRLGRSGEGWRLAVRNHGALPVGFDPEGATGFGLRMVATMVRQLGGRLEASSLGGETEFAVVFRPSMAQPPVLTVVEGDRERPPLPAATSPGAMG